MPDVRSRRASKAAALELAIRCVDLTTLEGADTPGKVRALAGKAHSPRPARPRRARRSAQCACTRRSCTRGRRGGRRARASRWRAWPARSRRGCRTARPAARRDPARRRRRRRRDRHRAQPLGVPLRSVQEAFDEIVAAKDACGAAHLKTILETGELGTYDQIRHGVGARDGRRLGLHQDVDRQDLAGGDAADRAVHGRGDPRLPARHRPRSSGLKLAGGIRTAKDAWQYLVVVLETLGPEWMTPDRLRLGRVEPAQRPAAAAGASCAPAATRSRRASRSTDRHTAMSDIEPRPASTSSTPTRRSRPRVVSLAPRYELFIGGRWVAPCRRCRTCPTINPATEAVLDRGRRGGRRPTSMRPCAPRATRGPRGRDCPAKERAKYVYRIARAAPGAGPRVRRARDARRRQADQGVARRRHPARRRALLLLRGLGRQARVRRARPPAAPARRRGADHPVELPAADGRVEARAGARHRQRVRAEAGGDDAAHRAAARGGHARKPGCRRAS